MLLITAFSQHSPICLLVGNVIEHLDCDTNDNGCSLLKFRGTAHLYHIHFNSNLRTLVLEGKSVFSAMARLNCSASILCTQCG